MTLLTKQEVLNAKDLPTVDVSVPEWGGDIRVRALTARERDAFEASLVTGDGKKRRTDLSNIRAKLVALCVVDGNGTRLFNDNEVSLLGAKSGAALDRVFTVCQKLAGLSAEDVDELAGKSAADLNGSSSLNSVSSSESATPITSLTDLPVAN